MKRCIFPISIVIALLLSGCLEPPQNALRGAQIYSDHRQTMEHNANTGTPIATPALYP